MIRKILTTYAARLDEYLARSHRQPEGVAEVGLIGSAGEQCPNNNRLCRQTSAAAAEHAHHDGGSI